MTILSLLAAVALLLLAAVAAGLVGFAVLGALRYLEGSLAARNEPVDTVPRRR